jgi:hypothetical protein
VWSALVVCCTALCWMSSHERGVVVLYVLSSFFLESSTEQIRSQMDVMWTYVPEDRVYYTSPRLNFGLVLLKAHPLSVKILEKSWLKYTQVPLARRKNVAIDQNIFGGMVGQARWKWGYNWSYFDIGYDLGKGAVTCIIIY